MVRIGVAAAEKCVSSRVESLVLGIDVHVLGQIGLSVQVLERAGVALLCGKVFDKIGDGIQLVQFGVRYVVVKFGNAFGQQLTP